ncbi:MAG: class I mannose-6-phosphate isomerase [Muribaculaceae bacterium]|nr:class I mannose-6-phosphate isomerase [Muribaculaceae bacterium]
MTKTVLYPLHFTPLLKSVIWGGDKLAPFKGIVSDRRDIGESWEVSGVPGRESVVDRGDLAGRSLGDLCQMFGSELLGERVVNRYGSRFPLLVKLICTSEDLSIQVHPDDLTAATEFDSLGKTELWYIIKAEEGARIISGVNRDITPSEFDQAVAEGNVITLLETHESRPGDVFLVPAGRIHAIGRGNLLLEIQEASDLTFRIDDYGRTEADGRRRPLHLEHARRVIDYKYYGGSRLAAPAPVAGSMLLAGCEHFKTLRLITTATRRWALPLSRGSFAIATCVEGNVTLSGDDFDDIALPAGDSILVPAAIRKATATGDATLIITTC